jgi:hypothetical protein
MNKPELQTSISAIIGVFFMFVFKFAFLFAITWMLCLVGIAGVESIRLNESVSFNDAIHDDVYKHAGLYFAIFMLGCYLLVNVMRGYYSRPSTDEEENDEDKYDSGKTQSAQ